MKGKLSILLILVILLIPVMAQAAWQIHSSFNLNTSNDQPRGLTSNSTSTSKGHIWTVDENRARIYEYNSAGTNIRSFSIAGIGDGIKTGIWINKTSNGSLPLWLSALEHATAYLTNVTGDSVTNITGFGPAGTNRRFITSIDTDAIVNTWHLLLSDIKTLKYLNASGGEISTCSVSSYATGLPGGITTNATNATTADLWIGDTVTSKIFRIGTDCALKETIDLNLLGISGPVGVEVLYRGTTVNDLLIISEDDVKVYRITQADDTPTMGPPEQNATLVAYGDDLKLNTTCLDDIGCAYCHLQLNETGVHLNYTDGTYGSPHAIGGAANTLNQTFFKYTNLLTKTSTTNINISWVIYCNDSSGNSNATVEQSFEATPLQSECTNSSWALPTLDYTSNSNLTASFVIEGDGTCFFILPRVNLTGNFTECSYKSEGAKRITGINYSATSCNISIDFEDLVNGTAYRIQVDEKISAQKRNLPAAIGSAILVAVIFVYAIVTRRRTD